MAGRTFAPHPDEMIERCQVCGVDPCECPNDSSADEKDIVSPVDITSWPRTQEALVLALIVELNRECSRLESLRDDAKAKAKIATGRWEASVEELQALIRKQDEVYPLLDALEPQEGSATPEWADAGIDLLGQYGISDAILAKLEQFGIETLGHLAAWNDGTKDLTDIPGIGQAKADKIRDALEGFWADWHGKHAEPAPSSNGDVTEGTS